ncbi:MAG: RHS repeat-associated core domain-containing protein [Nevskiaceae bacterium]|nr:MAG: RHS repeat-associated core domain-containing protein [Nevskiaceae bacterium]
MLTYNTTTGALLHRYYYAPDWHGSTVLLSDETANVTSFHYGAYGESQDPATGNPFRYTGRRLDAETGLYYYRARYYSTSLGRFLQTDPIGSKDDLNLYAYVKDDPVNNTDPQGTESTVNEDEMAKRNQRTRVKPQGSICSRLGGTACSGHYSAGIAGVMAGIGSQLGDAGAARADYKAAVGQLDPTDSAGRIALKAATREATPPLVRGVIEAARHDLGPQAGTGGTANSSNPGWNAAGKALHYGGNAMVVGGLAMDAYAISRAQNPYRELAGRSGALLFGTLGGLGGAIGGTAVAPGLGTIGGGIAGASGGSYFGGSWGYGLYDAVNDQ